MTPVFCKSGLHKWLSRLYDGWVFWMKVTETASRISRPKEKLIGRLIQRSGHIRVKRNRRVGFNGIQEVPEAPDLWDE